MSSPPYPASDRPDEDEYDGPDDGDDFQATQTGGGTQTQTQQSTQDSNSPNDYWAKLALYSHNLPDATFHQFFLLGESSHFKTDYKAGRNPGIVDFVLNDVRISNVHLKFSLTQAGGGKAHEGADREGRIIWLEDLKSSNGTWLNNKRLKAHKRTPLKDQDEIHIGPIPRSNGTPSKGGMRIVVFIPRADDVKKSVCTDKYHIMDMLGEGSFAKVYRGVSIDTNQIVAIKEIQKHAFINNKNTLALFEREIDIIGRLNHKNVCKFIEALEDDERIYIILEYVGGGNLLTYVMNCEGEGLPEEEAQHFTREICLGMAYTHSMGVAHRDLKPENVLLTDHGPNEYSSCKIADYGLAKLREGGTRLKSLVGTPQYLAPEVILNNQPGVGYDDSVDMWSVGIIVYAMLTKNLPFSEASEDTMEQKVRARLRDSVDYSRWPELGLSQDSQDFCEALLAKDPRDRMPFSAALKHPWLAPLNPYDPSASSASFSAARSSLAGASIITTTSKGSVSGSGLDTPIGDGRGAREGFFPAGPASTDGGAGGNDHAGLVVGASEMSVDGRGAGEDDMYSQPFSQLKLGKDTPAASRRRVMETEQRDATSDEQMAIDHPSPTTNGSSTNTGSAYSLPPPLAPPASNAVASPRPTRNSQPQSQSLPSPPTSSTNPRPPPSPSLPLPVPTPLKRKISQTSPDNTLDTKAAFGGSDSSLSSLSSAPPSPPPLPRTAPPSASTRASTSRGIRQASSPPSPPLPSPAPPSSSRKTRRMSAVPQRTNPPPSSSTNPPSRSTRARTVTGPATVDETRSSSSSDPHDELPGSSASRRRPSTRRSGGASTATDTTTTTTATSTENGTPSRASARLRSKTPASGVKAAAAPVTNGGGRRRSTRGTGAASGDQMDKDGGEDGGETGVSPSPKKGKGGRGESARKKR